MVVCAAVISASVARAVGVADTVTTNTPPATTWEAMLTFVSVLGKLVTNADTTLACSAVESKVERCSE